MSLTCFRKQIKQTTNFFFGYLSLFMCPMDRRKYSFMWPNVMDKWMTVKGFAAVREWPAHKWLRRHVTRVVVPLLLSPHESSHRQAPGAWYDLQFCLQFRCKSNSDGSASVSIQLKKLNLILVLFLLSLREDVFHSLGSEKKHPHTMPLEALVTCCWETNRNLDCSPHPSPQQDT